jgi:biotin synthase
LNNTCNTKESVKKALNNELLTIKEIISLLETNLNSDDFYCILYQANSLSRTTFKNKGENHLHIGLNASPCPYDCKFCSLTKEHQIFTKEHDFSWEEIMLWAKDAESKNADALNLMTTGTYSFERLCDIGKKLKKEVNIPLVANTRDLTHSDAEKLIECGFSGMYHAIRLGEGRVTPFSVEKRINTIKVLNDTGLKWMNCIEPIGPEHSYKEIAELMLIARKFNATYSGAMRRINFKGSPFEKYGMISELEMAKFVAVSRLVMGYVPAAHCTHEPNTLSLIAGANLVFPEVGSSPRDLEADSSKGRGNDIISCQKMFFETGWEWEKQSNCFN